MTFMTKSRPYDAYRYDLSMNSTLTFGEWLDDRLKERHWSQAAFAEHISVARQTVSSWVNNVQPPRRRVIRAIADALEVDVNEVLIRAGYPPTKHGYRLPEETARKPEAIDFEDPRLRFFAAKSGKLTDDEWDLIKRLIETLAEDE